jgi:hypothetical protein
MFGWGPFFLFAGLGICGWLVVTILRVLEWACERIPLFRYALVAVVLIFAARVVLSGHLLVHAR